MHQIHECYIFLQYYVFVVFLLPSCSPFQFIRKVYILLTIFADKIYKFIKKRAHVYVGIYVIR